MQPADLVRGADGGRWLDPSYFEKQIHGLARDLLGRALMRKVEGVWVGGAIVEVEVYLGAEDLASHARSGRATQRTWPMFGPAGLAYVYKIYGMYHCLNVSAPPKGGAGAILIRACEPLVGLEVMARRRGIITEGVEEERERQDWKPRELRAMLSGPGKICQAMGIDRSLSGTPMMGEEIGILDLPRRELIEANEIYEGPRIGLNERTCGEAVRWPWRYALRDSVYVSR